MIAVHEAAEIQLCKISHDVETAYSSGLYTEDDIADMVIDAVLRTYKFDRIADPDGIASAVEMYVHENFPKYFNVNEGER